MVAKCQICVWASNYFSSDSARRADSPGDISLRIRGRGSDERGINSQLTGFDRVSPPAVSLKHSWVKQLPRPNRIGQWAIHVRRGDPGDRFVQQQRDQVRMAGKQRRRRDMQIAQPQFTAGLQNLPHHLIAIA